MLKTRSKHDIVADILGIVQEPKLKTHVMFHANLSHAQIKHYVKLMEAREIIQKTDNNMWVITDKGRRLLKLYEEAESIALLDGRSEISVNKSVNKLTEPESPMSSKREINNNIEVN